MISLRPTALAALAVTSACQATNSVGDDERAPTLAPGGAYDFAATATAPAARIDGRGLSLRSPLGDPDLRLVLRAYGRAALEQPGPAGLPAATPCPPAPEPALACSTRVEAARDGLTDWYVGRPDGLEQGWDLHAPLPGEGPVRLALSVDGARLRLGAKGAWLVDETGAAWKVSRLRSWDADGTSLPTRLVPTAAGFDIEVDDTGATWPITVDPFYETPVSTLQGTTTDQRLGEYGGGVGDVNGDGYDDLAYGCLFPWLDCVGRVAVHLGGSAGPSPTAVANFQLASTTIAWTRPIPFGDIDGDGDDDFGLLAGATGVFDGNTRDQIGLIRGSPTVPVHDASVVIRSDLVPDGPGLFHAAKFTSMSGDGDINGDGWPDLVTSQNTYVSGSDEGFARILVHYGDGSSFAWPVFLPAPTTWEFGQTPAIIAGDLNGDGHDEVAVGDPLARGELGAVTIYQSPPVCGCGLHHVMTLTQPADSPAFGFGSVLYRLGDVNGDGFDDLGVFAEDTRSRYDVFDPLYEEGFDGEPESFVFLGGPTGLTAVPAWRALGAPRNQAAGDLNGDGRQDAFATAYTTLPDGTSRLRVDHFPGTPAGPGTEATQSYVVPLPTSGLSVGGLPLGDVDSDGYDDFAVRDTLWDGAGTTDAGRVFVHRGYPADLDGDGYAEDLDCDDRDPLVHPDAPERCNGLDDDCDDVIDDPGETVVFGDGDGDGFGDTTDAFPSPTCTAGAGQALAAGDCDDTSDTIFPGAPELFNNGTDEDCDGADDTCNGDGTSGDDDGDGVCEDLDACPGHPDGEDADGDGQPDACDPCPADDPDDRDGDGVCDSDDPCPDDSPDDADGDGVCDSDDPCPDDNPDDADGDGVCTSDDACPGADDTEDADADGVPDACDACPDDPPYDDLDKDGICNSDDICPTMAGNQSNADGDPFGLVCDLAPNCHNELDLGSALGSGIATGNTCGQSPSHGATCGGGAGAPDVAYTWRAPNAGTYTFSLVGSGYNTVLHLRDVNTCAPLVCNDDKQPPTILTSEVQRTFATAGQVVVIVVDGLGAATCGTYTLAITGPAACDTDGDGLCFPSDTCPLDPEDADADNDGVCDRFDACIGTPASGDADGDDWCNDADPAPTCPQDDVLGSTLGTLVTMVDTCRYDATRTASCGPGTARDASYVWTAPYDGTFTFTAGAWSPILPFDPLLTLARTDSCAELACNDDVSASDKSAVASTDLLAGESVLVTVDAFASPTCGKFNLGVTGVCRDDDGDGACNHEDACPDAPDLGTDLDGDGTDDACDACLGSDGLGDADLDGVCDGTPFALVRPAPEPGGPSVFQAYGAPPGTTIYLLGTIAGTGEGPCEASTGLCTDLLEPRVLGIRSTAARGPTSFPIVTKKLPPGTTIWAQAAWIDPGTLDGEVSNVFTATY